jgi:hypothetical protein
MANRIFSKNIILKTLVLAKLKKSRIIDLNLAPFRQIKKHWVGGQEPMLTWQHRSKALPRPTGPWASLHCMQCTRADSGKVTVHRLHLQIAVTGSSCPGRHTAIHYTKNSI